MPSEYREKLIAELRECEALGELVEVHKWDDDPTIFLVGIVRKVTTRTLTFDDVDTDGLHDKQTTVPLANIVLIRRGNIYLRRLRMFYETQFAKGLVPKPRDVRRKDLIRALLANAFAAKQMVSIWLDKNRIEGHVKSCSHDHIELWEIDESGHGDGTGLYRLKEIRRARMGTMHEFAIEYARQHPTDFPD